jgi:DNA-binding NtrC family response regulator
MYMGDYVLIVEDDVMQRHMLGMALKKDGLFSAIDAEHGREALSILEQPIYRQKIRAVIMDLEMPIMGGMETLQIISEQYPNLPVIMLTGHDDPAHIVQAMKYGAVDFITKPYEPKRVIITLQNAIKLNSLSQEITRLKGQKDHQLKFSDLIGHDRGLKDTIDHARKAAQSTIPVLITGQTGVGKDLLAQAIHGESERAGKPFVAINCGAIPTNLIESTLFGHEKGAFTGAVNASLGKFREADGGTIFLDEVGELPRDAQVKLLRVLQQKEIEPVGAGKSVPVNVRIISATNRNLQKDVKDGLFREDLFFRLNVFTINIPSLAERREDISDLTHFFVAKYCAMHKKQLKTISDRAIQFLQSHYWSGNIRELENIIHREIVLSDANMIHEFGLSSEIPVTQVAVDTDKSYFYHEKDMRLKTLDELETEAIRHALKAHNGDVINAAKDLGVAKSTLYRKLERIIYGASHPRFSDKK